MDRSRVFSKATRRSYCHRFNWLDAIYTRTALGTRWCCRAGAPACGSDVLFSQVRYLPLFEPRHNVLLLQDAKFFYDSEALRQRLTVSERLTLWMKKR